jgi:DNA-directed RNA polymerase specialized sigma24 family protein
MNSSDPLHSKKSPLEQLLHSYGLTSPRGLEAELRGWVAGALRGAHLDPKAHGEDVLQEVLCNISEALKRETAIRNIRAWCFKVTRSAALRYIEKWKHGFDVDQLEELRHELNGSKLCQLSESSSDEPAYRLFWTAVAKLRPRHRQLILLDAARHSLAEIRTTMGLRSDGYTRKLKCEAFKSLREELKHLLP